MANDPKKKLKGEPTAGDQRTADPVRPQSRNYAGSSDDAMINDAIKVATVGNNKGVVKSFSEQAAFWREDAKHYKDKDAYDYRMYRADLIDWYGKNAAIEKDPQRKIQNESKAETGQQRTQQKKKTATLTGNQGIIGSMMNLGGNKLLGGN